ncbi:hypothetical protein [Desulfonatronum parangueonense]
MIEHHHAAIRDLVLQHGNRITLFFLRKKLLNFCPELKGHPQVLYLDDYLDHPFYAGITDKLTTGSFSCLFASMLGYRIIGLLGIDCDYVQMIPESKKISGNIYEIRETPVANPNYFVDDYQQRGDRFNIPDSIPNLHYESWKIVKERLEKFNVVITNYSQKSSLDIFDKVELSQKVVMQNANINSINIVIKKQYKNYNKEKIILVSGFFPKEKKEYFEKLDDNLKYYNYRLLLQEQTENIVNTKCLSVSTPIKWFSKNENFIYNENEDFVPHYEVGKDIFPGHTFSFDLIYAALSHSKEKGNMPDLYSLLKMKSYESYLQKLFNQYEIALCLIWHQFTGRNHVLSHICRKFNIPYLFMEFGSLPGSIVFEADGGMGESRVTRNSDVFCRLPVDNSDIQKAENYLKICRDQKVNRPLRNENNIQCIDDIIKITKIKKRKIIFFAGQNDWGAGIFPQPWPRRDLHSPLFRHTKDALNYLSIIASKNNWQILFKPHPFVSRYQANIGISEAIYSDIENPEFIDIVADADIFDCIDAADVCTTILSQSAYLFLIYNKPTVLLGRMQLTGKSCLYEPKNLKDVERYIKKALDEGLSKHQMSNFVKHVAQLCMYNLFSADKSFADCFGRNYDHASASIVHYINNGHINNLLPFGYEKLDYLRERNSVNDKCGSKKNETKININLEKYDDIIFLGYFLSGSTSHQNANKSKFWFSGNDNFINRFNRTVYVEHSSSKNLKNATDDMLIKRFPSTFQDFQDKNFNTDKIKNYYNSLLNFVDTDIIDQVFNWEDAIYRGAKECIPPNNFRGQILHSINNLLSFTESVKFGEGSLLITHGHTPISFLLRSVSKKFKTKNVFAEHGELPNTMMLSENGFFYDSWPAIEQKTFMSLPLDEKLINSAANIVNQLSSARIAHKNYDVSDKNFLEFLDKKTVIYLNGILPTNSGILPRSSRESKVMSPYFENNIDLLIHLQKIADLNGWHIVYKDHPLVYTNSPGFAIKPEKFKFHNVHILRNIDIHDVFDVTDVMVTLASKSVILALARGVPVCIPGRFTIPKDAITPGFLESNNLELDIKILLNEKKEHRVNFNDFYKFVARLRKYYLYPIPGTEDEGTKKNGEAFHDLNEFMQGRRRRISLPD